MEESALITSTLNSVLTLTELEEAFAIVSSTLSPSTVVSESSGLTSSP